MDEVLEKQLCETVDFNMRVLRHNVLVNLMALEKQKGNINDEQWKLFCEVASEKAAKINMESTNQWWLLLKNRKDIPKWRTKYIRIIKKRFKSIRKYKFN